MHQAHSIKFKPNNICHLIHLLREEDCRRNSLHLDKRSNVLSHIDLKAHVMASDCGQQTIYVTNRSTRERKKIMNMLEYFCFCIGKIENASC